MSPLAESLISQEQPNLPTTASSVGSVVAMIEQMDGEEPQAKNVSNREWKILGKTHTAWYNTATKRIQWDVVQPGPTDTPRPV